MSNGLVRNDTDLYLDYGCRRPVRFHDIKIGDTHYSNSIFHGLELMRERKKIILVKTGEYTAIQLYNVGDVLLEYESIIHDVLYMYDGITKAMRIPRNMF